MVTNSRDTDTLVQKFTQLETEFFGDYKDNVEKNRRYYNREFAAEVSPNDQIKALVPPTARRAIDDPADHILTLPRVSVPVKPGPDPKNQQEIAEKKRRFLGLAWQNIAENFALFESARKLMLLEGRVCVRASLKWDLIPDLPGKGADKAAKRKFQAAMKKLGHYEFLWDYELLDTLSVFEDPSNHRDPNYVFVMYEVTREDAKASFPDAGGTWREGNDYEQLKYMEYWTKPKFKSDGTYEPGEYTQWVDEERVHSGENPYPYVPIAIDDAGYGLAHRTSKIHEKYVGHAQHVLDTFVAEARQMTTWENVTEMSGFPIMVTRNMEPGKRLTIGPRETVPLDGAEDDPNRESIEFVQWPSLPLEVIQLAQRTQQMVDEAVKMNSLGGVPLRGVETATESDMHVRNAQAKLSGPVGGLNRIAGKLSKWMLMDIELVLSAPVTVFGAGASSADVGEITLGPKDIGGFYHVRAELATLDEDAIRLNKARFWAEMYRVCPFLSAFTVMERGDISDEPLAEMIRRSAEDVFLSEEMTMIRKFTGAQSFGEFAQMVSQLVKNEKGGTGGAAPGGGSDQGLVEQANVGGPVTNRQQDIFQEALAQRDVGQAGEAFR